MSKVLSEKNFRVMLITNSVKFADDEFLRRTVETGISGITTSFKAPTPETYKKMTGKDAFGQVVQAIQNIECRISLTICGRMAEWFDETLLVLVKNGVKMVSFDIERPTIRDGKAHLEEGMPPKEMADFIVNMYPKMMAMGIRFNIKIGLPFCLFPNGFIQTLVERQQIISGCQIFGGSGLIVDFNGNILPCNHFCKHPLGHLDECGDFYKWREREDIKHFYSVIGSYPAKRCQECSQWKYCGAGCRIHWLNAGAKELFPA